VPFKTIVFDESHFLKNYKAERTRLAIQISKKCKNVILLTGTPLLNRPIELYTQVKIVNPHLFDYKNFVERYCDAKIVQVYTRNGIKSVKDVKGASNLDELKEKLKSIMIRKLKKDVLTELPPKTISVIPFITDLKEYQHLLFSPELFNEVQRYEEYIKKIEENAEKEIIKDVEEEFNKIRLHGFIERLKQEAVKSKLEQAIEFINNTLEQNEKVVVFVHHRFVVEELKKAFPEALIITGETPPAERIKNLDEFTKNPDKHLLIASIRVAGYGLNLSVSNTAIFLEFDWNYHTHLQCEDRLHRIGQTQPVNIYYLVAVGTIEEKICQLIDAKRKVVASAIDDLKTELLSRVDMLKNLAEYLIGEIKNEKK
jgi:SWI/SNF-related matrix-associated actin-dependent regulator 1 of chromatin subfamily A